MMRPFSLVIFCLATTTAGHADEPKVATGAQVRPLFKDDFSKDTRKKYQIKGDVQWTPGSMMLGRGASIVRGVEAGPWIQMECDLRLQKKVPNKVDRPLLELRLQLHGATDFVLMWLRLIKNGQVRYVLVVADTVSDGASGKKLERVRGWQLPRFTSGVWRISYRWGAIRILPPGNDRPLFAYVDNRAATIRSIGLTAFDPGKLAVCSLDVAGTNRTRLTVKEEKDAARRYC